MSPMRNDNESCEKGGNILNPEWMSSIKQNLEQGKQDAVSLSPKLCCIYRVPQSLREMNEEAFAPQIVSLGPYHHGKARYSKMECQKWRILQHVLDLNSQDIVIYLVALKHLEERVRKYYEEPVNLSTNQFVEMMTLDGIFLLEFLRIATGRSRLMEYGYCLDDPIFSNRGMVKTIVEDILKLENQLPLFLLDALLKLGTPNSKGGEVPKLITPVFENLLRIKWLSHDYQTAIYSPLDEDYFHCLDIFLKGLLEATLASKENGVGCSTVIVRPKHICSETTTGDAMILFEEKNVDVRYRRSEQHRISLNDVWNISHLHVSTATKSLLFNLIAYKKCDWIRWTIINPYQNCNGKLNSKQEVPFHHSHGTIGSSKHLRNDNERCEDRCNLLNPELTASIKQNLDQGRQMATSLSAKSCCIYRFPQRLGERIKYAFDPEIISLGPYHHGNKRYSEMERQKWRILQHVLNRNSQDIEIYLVALKQLEEKVRKCYEVLVDLTTNQFIQMMTVDGIFLLEFLRIASGQSGYIELGYYPYDPIFSDPSKISTISQDILKLKNQLPLFLLDVLLQLENPGLKGEAPKLILPVIQNLMPIDWLSSADQTAIYLSPNEDYLHCLDMLLRGLLKASMVKGDGTLDPIDGIKLNDKQSLKSVKIKFHNAIHEVSQVIVSWETQSLLYNLTAYEECHPTCWSKIGSHAILIDRVNSEQDV